MKKILILGGGGFIGGHLGNRLKKEGSWVRIVDIKMNHEFWNHKDICDEYIQGDLRDPVFVSEIMKTPNYLSVADKINSFDEVYQLAADMGGAGYIFTGENDANLLHNSAMINLNVVYEATKKSVKKIFYSSSACIYPEYNQLDPANPNCIESSVYPANPDSEYGWEKLFSERLFLAFNRNYNLNIRIARFHNIFGPKGTWNGGKEKAPAAICRKVIESSNNIEIWGNGKQTRSFLYIDDCIEAILLFMRQESFTGPVNIGSEEMISINDLAKMVINISKKNLTIKNIEGIEFFKKYGFKCPIGVLGRTSDNTLYKKMMGWSPKYTLLDGLKLTYKWINEIVTTANKV